MDLVDDWKSNWKQLVTKMSWNKVPFTVFLSDEIKQSALSASEAKGDREIFDCAGKSDRDLMGKLSALLRFVDSQPSQTSYYVFKDCVETLKADFQPKPLVVLNFNSLYELDPVKALEVWDLIYRVGFTFEKAKIHWLVQVYLSGVRDEV